MDTAGREALDQRVLQAVDDGAIHDATSAMIRGYGPEILGFLTATLRDEASAEDVFSIFCENVLKGIAAFERRSSLRTWAYTVARHAAQRYGMQRRRRAARELQVPGGAPLSAVAAQVRSETAAHLRTEIKSRFVALRDALAEEDRALLILRVDKGLEWTEIASILFEQKEGAGGEPDLKRESARLRKRFQSVKERLVELGKKEGLLP